MREVHEMTREELYEQVWTQPMTSLATRYGLSDNGLRKICKRNGIPCPPPGHWARVAAGQKVKRAALPKSSESNVITIGDASVQRSARSRDMSKMDAAIPIITPIRSTDLQTAHPLVLRMYAALRRADRQIAADAARDALRAERARQTGHWEPNWDRLNRPDRLDHDRVIPKGAPCSCLVSLAQRERALLLLDSIIRTGELAGLHFQGGATQATVKGYGGAAKIKLFEVLEKHANKTEYNLGRLLKPTVMVPCGILRLVIEGDDLPTIRVTDALQAPLEKQVATIIAKAIRGLLQFQERKRHQEQQIAEAEEKQRIQDALDAAEEKRRQHAKEARQRETYRRDKLFAEAKAWEESERVRRYVAATLAAAENIEPAQREKIDEWARWADSVAAVVDPTRRRGLSR